MENIGQFTGVRDCQVGEYVNHLITNYSLRRAFKYIVNETSKISHDSKCTMLYKTQNRSLFQKRDLFQRVSYLKDVLHEKQLVLTQIPTPSTVLFKVDIYSKPIR